MSFIREIVKKKKDNSEIVTSNEDFIPTHGSVRWGKMGQLRKKEVIFRQRKINKTLNLV